MRDWRATSELGEQQDNAGEILVPLSVPLKLRFTRISACLRATGRCLSYCKYWLAGL